MLLAVSGSNNLIGKRIAQSGMRLPGKRRKRHYNIYFGLSRLQEPLQCNVINSYLLLQMTSITPITRRTSAKAGFRLSSKSM